MTKRESANVAHTALTDHRILKRPDSGAAKSQNLPPGQFPLVAYAPGPHAPPPWERDRDWAIALGNEFARTNPPLYLWLPAEAKLDHSLRRWPADGPLLLARSRAFLSRGNPKGGVEVAQVAVALEPDSEVALVQLAGAAVAADDFALAVRTADKLIPLNPSSIDHRLTRAVAYLYLNDWQKAESDCREALAIQPLHPNGHFMLAVCLHKQGNPIAGQRELDIALRLAPTPQVRSALLDEYRRLTR
jgi:tetratricopeptide (TPR) repeat protein